ncbi:MAG: Crp/Fnr family transcriptional regulator [Deltaproteobacteria bacterium]|nr:Crp/Fnr family transcriptional regulator [Deltaproteobacteria bacterium]MBI5902457.1 Crp/Fnr family transcriptional regulator [Deltaproteobacteria bacterium]
MKDKNFEQVLSRNPLFSGLEEFYIKDLAARGEVKSWSEGSQVIVEGEAGEEVYFIISGKVKVTLYGEEGREIVLASLKEGDVFGEMSIIDDKPRSANVEAVTALECLVINKTAFLDYLARHHRVYGRLFAYLTGRLREATRKIGGLALLDVCGRIAHTLIGMSRAGEEEKVVSIERPTHEELAAMIGSSREVVSRALKKMTQEGYIKIEKDRIFLYMQ